VIGTGISHSVEDFLRQVLVELYRISGGADVPSVEDWVEIDSHLLRTGEIHDLTADASLAHNELAWQPSVDFPQLVRMMLEADVASSREAKRAPDNG
ncbi:MAG: GDP-mannose 4,6-dehydratase, partial [Acidobacteria bacterium]|nr:GDP-mannose 4,6-dehydratase [Acidobacteriota bacterium]